VGVTRPRFGGGEKKLGTGDFRGSSAVCCENKRADFFSGEGGRGTLAAVFNEVVGDVTVCRNGSRLVGDGGGLARIVSSFSSP